LRFDWSVLPDGADHRDLLDFAKEVEFVCIDARAGPSDPIAAALVVGPVAQCITSVCVASRQERQAVIGLGHVVVAAAVNMS
jgi:hypothetical protein